MAKASAQITLHYVVDIKAAYRYYLLQGSTLSKPDKPTTYPPSSSWDDTEPTYTEGSTNSLYFVDCTVFCDDTYKYSEVSLSTSYEAAKQAYNKASNAQNDVDNLENTLEETNSAIQTQISETVTNIEESFDKIILSALESYVTTGDYEEFKSQLAELYITPGEVDIKISNVDSRIDGVEKDKDNRLEVFEKYFEFTETGLSIKESSGFELQLDSGMIRFVKNGNTFGWWDGVDFHTGNIVVETEERAQFGNFAFVPRKDGSLQLLKVGGN